MNQIYKKSRAKINLTLHILDKRPDGYHNLESVFQIVHLYDELFIEKTEDNHLTLICNVKELENENNIIYKAYHTLKQKHSGLPGVKVTLKKNIPSGAGLGGGSANCASFLTAMNQLFDLHYSKQDLINIGKTLGADVPPCLHNGALLAQGIGEILTPICTNMKYYIVLVKPDISFNTKLMYAKLDERKNNVSKQHSATHPVETKTNFLSHKAIQSLETNNMSSLCNNLYNNFEQTLAKDSEIFTIQHLLLEHGALCSSMTGSGSACFGIFDDKELSKKAYQSLKKTYQSFWSMPKNSEKL